MWIDLLFLLVMIIAVIKGVMRGIVLALFSFVGWFIGLAAALKLSAVVAVYLQDHTSINATWLPLLSFLLVFVLVVLLVQWAGKALEGILKLALLGWVNKLGGALLYAGMYTLIFSVLLFYADKMGLINKETLAASKLYAITAGLAPAIIEGIGALIPALKETFHQLEDFFENAGKKLS
ncbi:MAG: CvpA family protein [Chitinophagaceae bacterium]|nr:CvpA family protein [Chitinophagaceae bacterium]